MTTAMSITALMVAVAAVLSGLVLRVRLRRAEVEVRALARRVAEAEAHASAAASDAVTALGVARRAAAASGVAEPPPRLVLEPITGPVVRAVALGAGARRALGRLTRRTTRRAA
jgi:hypothetical protein